jgi:hypothetical protein
VYKWSAGAAQFELVQGIATTGAINLEAFAIAGRPMLAVASHYDGVTYDINSFVYAWNASQYVLNQTLATRGATQFKSFEVGGESFLLVANHRSTVPATHATTSELWRWSAFAGQFVSQQLIPTVGAFGWEVFVHGGTTYAAYTSLYSGSSHSSNSSVFTFDPVSRTLAVVASTPTVGASGVLALSVGGTTKLWTASYYTGSSFATTSVLFGFNGTALVREQGFATNGPRGVSAAWVPTDGGETPLVFVQDHHNGSTSNLQVRTFEWRCRDGLVR